jgi:hypothetical protein
MVSLYDYDGSPDLMLGKKLFANEAKLVEMTERVFVKLDVPDGTMSNKIFFAIADNDAEPYLLFLSEYSSPWKQNEPKHLPTGCSFHISERFPDGICGSIWAVSTDESGVEYTSNIIDVIWEPANA